MTAFSKKRAKHRQLVIPSAGLLCLLALAGCASPKVVFVKDDASFKEYKRAYLPSGEKEKDPRGLTPAVASKLRELGFDVKEVKKHEEGSQGTGFVISPAGHVLTAAHVLAMARQATIWLGGKRVEAEVVCSDKDKDMALLKPTRALSGPVEPLFIDFDTPAKMGQDVYTIGFPLSGILGRSPRLTKGLVSSTVGLKDDPDSLQVSVEVQAGNSGGPLLDADGHVLGVLQATLNPMAVLRATGGRTLPQNVNFAAKSQQIKFFLDGCPGPVALASRGTRTYSFDTVKDSIAQVYSGLVSADFVTEPKLAVGVSYGITSTGGGKRVWVDMFQIELYDFDNGQLLLRAGQYGRNVLASEKNVINKTFEVIRDRIGEREGTAQIQKKKKSRFR